MWMKRTRRCKCRCCGELYRPDYRNVYHQSYCRKPACRSASKQASQRRWSRQSTNRDYHRGEQQVERVRIWRKAHPGYWRRKAGALQDLCSAQPIQPQVIETYSSADISLNELPLQDHCLSQDPLFVGFMAHITGASQEDIVTQLARFQSHGIRILRKGPGMPTNEGADDEDTKAGTMCGAGATNTRTV